MSDMIAELNSVPITARSSRFDARAGRGSCSKQAWNWPDGAGSWSNAADWASRSSGAYMSAVSLTPVVGPALAAVGRAGDRPGTSGGARHAAAPGAASQLLRRDRGKALSPG